MAKDNKNTKSGKNNKNPQSNVKKENKSTSNPPADIFAKEEVTVEIPAEVETPADAPVAPSVPQEPVATEETRPADDEATAPAPKNKIVPAAPSREETPEENTGEQPIAENPAEQPAAVAAPINKDDIYIGPGSPHSDEEKLERYLKNRNNVTKLTHIQLGQSGINMSKISLLVGRVGKFKLKRDFVVESWKITIE